MDEMHEMLVCTHPSPHAPRVGRQMLPTLACLLARWHQSPHAPHVVRQLAPQRHLPQESRVQRPRVSASASQLACLNLLASMGRGRGGGRGLLVCACKGLRVGGVGRWSRSIISRFMEDDGLGCKHALACFMEHDKLACFDKAGGPQPQASAPQSKHPPALRASLAPAPSVWCGGVGLMAAGYTYTLALVAASCSDSSRLSTSGRRSGAAALVR